MPVENFLIIQKKRHFTTIDKGMSRICHSCISKILQEQQKVKQNSDKHLQPMVQDFER